MSYQLTGPIELHGGRSIKTLSTAVFQRKSTLPVCTESTAPLIALQCEVEEIITIGSGIGSSLPLRRSLEFNHVVLDISG